MGETELTVKQVERMKHFMSERYWYRADEDDAVPTGKMTAIVEGAPLAAAWESYLSAYTTMHDMVRPYEREFYGEDE